MAGASVNHINTCINGDISLALAIVVVSLQGMINEFKSWKRSCLTCKNRGLEQLYQFVYLNEHVYGHLEVGATGISITEQESRCQGLQYL